MRRIGPRADGRTWVDWEPRDGKEVYLKDYDHIGNGFYVWYQIGYVKGSARPSFGEFMHVVPQPIDYPVMVIIDRGEGTETVDRKRGYSRYGTFKKAVEEAEKIAQQSINTYGKGVLGESSYHSSNPYGQSQGNPGNPQQYQQYFGKSARWFQSPKPLTVQEKEGAIIRQKSTGRIATIAGKSGGGFAIFLPMEGSFHTMLFLQTDQWEVIGREY